MKFQESVLFLGTLFVASSDAFAPASSFIPRPAAVNIREIKVFCPIPATRAAPNTALQMNLFDRFVRVTKGNLNNVLENLESPEKIMNQAMEDMQNDLLQVRQAYAEITATQRRLLKQREEAETRAREWYARAQLALRNNNESLAREALARRQQLFEVINGIQSQLDVQSAALDKLYQGMNALEARIIETKGKKDQFIARAKAAESTRKVNDMLSGITGKTSMDAFKRMEEKIEALEAAAEASAEVSTLFGTALPGSSESDLENQFLLLEGSSAVDDELKRMKSHLLGSTESRNSKLYDPAIDGELNEMKKEAKVSVRFL